MKEVGLIGLDDLHRNPGRAKLLSLFGIDRELSGVGGTISFAPG